MTTTCRIAGVTCCLFGVLCFTSSAAAHYLWVKINGPVANVYFEEAATAGDGHYLDPFVKSGKTWIRTVQQLEPQPLDVQEKVEDKKRWLAAELKQSAPRSVDSYGKFGVYRYGNTDVLLHYYARYLDVATHEDLHELARAEQMTLDIVPHDEGDEIEIQVLWKGAPAAGRMVYLRGPARMNKNIETNQDGIVRFAAEKDGIYTVRTFVELDTAGREGDQEYSLIRHHATMIMKLPLEK